MQVESSRIAYVLAGHLMQYGVVDEESYRKPSEQGVGCIDGIALGAKGGLTKQLGFNVEALFVSVDDLKYVE